MKFFFRSILFFLFFFTFLFASEPSWTGKWNVNWTAGTFILNLEQHGSEVNGTYSPDHGILQGKIKGSVLTAETTTGTGVHNHLVLTLSDSGNSFFGNTEFGGWITGIKADRDKVLNTIKPDLSSPLKAFYSFLALGNAVRAGDYEVLEQAMEILAFTQKQEGLRHAVKLDLTTTYFNIIDECLVNRTDFFKESSEESHSILLHQQGTKVSVPMSFVQDKDGVWKIEMPTETFLEEKLQALLKARGKYEVDPHANLALATPRDTLRTFYEEYERWENGGKKYVISTMNLSEVDPAIHKWQAPLLAYYLKSVLNRISTMVYQEIPNDPKSKKPYVHFYHDIANIVIAPYTVEGNRTVWLFAPQTLVTIDELYNEMENVKEKYPTKEIAENNLYFKLKSTAKKISPLLLEKVNYAEIWQIILLSIIIVLELFISWLIRYVVIYLF